MAHSDPEKSKASKASEDIYIDPNTVFKYSVYGAFFGTMLVFACSLGMSMFHDGGGIQLLLETFTMLSYFLFFGVVIGILPAFMTGIMVEWLPQSALKRWYTHPAIIGAGASFAFGSLILMFISSVILSFELEFSIYLIWSSIFALIGASASFLVDRFVIDKQPKVVQPQDSATPPSKPDNKI